MMKNNHRVQDIKIGFDNSKRRLLRLLKRHSCAICIVIVAILAVFVNYFGRAYAFYGSAVEIAPILKEMKNELKDILKEQEADNDMVANLQYVINSSETTMISNYIDALKYGMPPAVGVGIGIDRLVMLATNKSSIKYVIIFPTLK